MFFDLEDYSPAPAPAPAPDREDAPSPLVLWIVMATLAMGVLLIWAGERFLP